MNYLEKFSIFSENPYCFRKKERFLTSSYAVMEKIQSNWKSKVKTNGIFVDFKKAFDSVDHKTLLQKLYYIGIRGISHKLLEHYLTDRYQLVKIEDKCCTIKPIKRGVQQGSKLVPVLFFVYKLI